MIIMLNLDLDGSSELDTNSKWLKSNLQYLAHSSRGRLRKRGNRLQTITQKKKEKKTSIKLASYVINLIMYN